MKLSTAQIMAFAREGAQRRIAELNGELATIAEAFPDLFPGVLAAQAAPRERDHAPAKRKPGRRGWSAAARKAQGDRMRARWAKRKAAGRSASRTNGSGRSARA